MQPQNGVQATEQFLNLIWNTDHETSRNYYGCITPEDVYRNVFASLGHSDSDASALEQFDDDNVWFCPVLFWTDANRRRESVAGTWCLWVDIDGDEPTTLEQIFDQSPVKPNIIIESSPGRFHVYWLLAEFLRDKELIQKYNTVLAESISGADHSGWDAAQLLRLPLGVNRKIRANGHKPAIVHMDTQYALGAPDLDDMPEPSTDSWKIQQDSVDVEMPEDPLSWRDLPQGLGDLHKQYLINGAKRGKRSEAVYTVVLALADHGVQPNAIAGYLYKSPLSARFDRNESRITREVSRILSKRTPNVIKDGTPHPLAVNEPAVPENVDPITGEIKDGTPHPDPEPEQEVLNTNLPDEFWESREFLKDIRQAAHSRCASADAVFGHMLGRFSSMMSHKVHIETGLGPMPLNMFTVILGKTGAGKGKATSAAWDLLTVPRRLTMAKSDLSFIDGQSIGTGEGIIEAFMGEVTETGPSGKAVKKRTQARFNVFFDVDEGLALATQSARENAILSPTICSAFTGAPLGQANASAERTRFLPKNSYSLGMVIGFQYSTVASLLTDMNLQTGLPQRFLWLSANDPSIPELPIEPPTIPIAGLNYNPDVTVTVADEISAIVWQQSRALTTGESEASTEESQKGRMLAKIAGLLTLFDGRTHVEMEDWDLAGVVFDTSFNVLKSAQRFQAEEKQRINDIARKERAFNEEVIHLTRAQAPDKMVQVALNLSTQVNEKGRSSWSELRKGLSVNGRKLMGNAIIHCLSQGWIVEVIPEKRYAPGNPPSS